MVRPELAAILDEDDRFIARSIYLKKMEKNLSIFAEIEKEKPKLYALIEMNISERSKESLTSSAEYYPDSSVCSNWRSSS